jgi:hypothetical protein
MIIAISGYMGSGKDTVASMLQYLFNLSNPDLNLKPSYEDYQDALQRMETGIDPYSTLENPFVIKKFAAGVKKVAALMLNVDESCFESQEFKKASLPEVWDIPDELRVIPGKIFEKKRNMTYREFLQKLGTDAIRNHLHQDAWVNVLFAQYLALNPSKRVSYTENDFDYANCDFPNWIISDLRFPNEYEAVKKRKNSFTLRVNRNIGDQYAQKHESETAIDHLRFDLYIDNTGSLKDLYTQVTGVHRHLLKMKN